MATERGTVIYGRANFDAVLDETCERLWDTKVRYSLRRIKELDAVLGEMERELDEMIRAAPVSGRGSPA